jgi:dipeptidase
LLITVEVRSASNLRFRDVCMIAPEFSVISELVPWDRMMMGTDPQKAAERHMVPSGRWWTFERVA